MEKEGGECGGGGGEGDSLEDVLPHKTTLTVSTKNMPHSENIWNPGVGMRMPEYCGVQGNAGGLCC